MLETAPADTRPGGEGNAFIDGAIEAVCVEALGILSYRGVEHDPVALEAGHIVERQAGERDGLQVP